MKVQDTNGGFAPVSGSPWFPVLLGGLALGAGLVVWGQSLTGLFGSAMDTRWVLLAEAAAAGAVGLRRPAGTARAIAVRCLLAAALTAFVAFVPGGGGRALGWVGASLDSGAFLTGFARLLVGGCLVVPAGLAVGSALAGAAATASSGVLALGAAGLVWGAWGVQWTTLTSMAAGIPAGGAAGLGLVSAVAWWLRGGGEPAAPADADGDPAPSVVPLLTGLAVAGAVAGFAILAPRLLVPAFGNDLPGVPLARTLFLAGLAGGASAGLLAGRWLPGPFAVAVTQLALAAAASFALLVTGAYDALPSRFTAAVAAATGYDAVLDAARSIALPRAGGLGALVGFAAAMFASSVPSLGAGRQTWIRRAGLGGAVGAVLGVTLASGTIAPWGLGGALATIGLLGVLPATFAVIRAPLPAVARSVFLLLGIGGVTAAIVRAPVTDRSALLVEAGLRSSSSPFQTVQRSWTVLDEDDAARTATVLRRGHERRVLVNGRFELSRESTEKSHGILAHLPLAVHGPADRVLVVGAGTGWAIGSVLAHAVDQVDCIEWSPTLVDAAREFGPGAVRALSNERVSLYLGDPAELLARAAPYDVILLEPSGAWTERSAAVSTREFLTLARARLAPRGQLAHWVPGNSLTKSGFQILLATYCQVFPRVEVWGGQGGDVILLASESVGRHDFTRLRAAYDNVVAGRAIVASWIGTPETLLSQFLLDDGTTRRVAARQPVSTTRNAELAHREAARRITEPTVDPVPGLVALRGDVLGVFDNLPSTAEFTESVARATRARDLERAALDLELERRDFEAASTYKEALALNPADRAVRRALATLRSQMGIHFANDDKLTAAHGYLREAVEIDSTYASGFANLGRLLSQLEDYDYAISVLRQATSVSPDDDLFHVELGRVWKMRGYYDKALPWYERALQLNPINVDAAVGYMDCRLAMQGENADIKEGLAFYEKYLELEPTNNELLERVARFRDVVRRRESTSP